MVYVIYLHSTFHLISISHISIDILQQIEMLFVALQRRRTKNDDDDYDSPCCASVIVAVPKVAQIEFANNNNTLTFVAKLCNFK